ncbi:AAA family ATPase [Shinella sp. HZN7]|uniref:AAA family ATPase n=1 Tax=Shinella sp. (strain HZN7) TaxID=879274 RepID=UPI0007DA4C0F|nr:ATP-binding protein [Shinella sp. HZN7]ANH05011.1 DNA transposition protein [Shinella sp. HZN7]
MRNTIVDTTNVKKFMGALTSLNDRGAVEACMVVVDGEPGLGKTTTLSRWVAQTGSVYVRAQVGWDYGWFINTLLREMSIHPPRSKEERYERLLKELAERAARADFEGKTFGLVIDECDLVSTRPAIMEAIRGISDIQFLPTILVGMGRLRENLRRFPQIESRAPRKVRFEAATLDDTRAIIAARCEVPVAPDLVEFVWKVSRGYNREILEAIAHIERFGFRMEPGPEGVTMSDMAGQMIMNDRSSGKPIMLPRAA